MCPLALTGSRFSKLNKTNPARRRNLTGVYLTSIKRMRISTHVMYTSVYNDLVGNYRGAYEKFRGYQQA